MILSPFTIVQSYFTYLWIIYDFFMAIKKLTSPIALTVCTQYMKIVFENKTVYRIQKRPIAGFQQFLSQFS